MRTITTADELNALPDMSVILLGIEDVDFPYVLAAQKDSGGWFIVNDLDGHPADDLFNGPTPFSALVVWEQGVSTKGRAEAYA